MRIDSPGLTTDLDLLRLQGSTVTDHGDHLVVRTEANPTFWWGNFLLVRRPPRATRSTAGPHASRRSSRTRSTERSPSPSAGGDTDAWAAQGWDVEVDVDLATTSVPAGADVPDGIRLGPLRPTTTGSSRRRSAAATPRRTGATAASSSSGAGPRRSAGLVESGRARWFGAFDDDRLVANLGIVRLGDLARYQDVVTLESHRRRGIAGALVRAAGEWALRTPPWGRLVIVAEDGGPAIGLYQRAGFVEVARHVGASRSSA